MPKELTFNIKTNSNLSALIKELKDLKAAVDDVNKSSGGGGGGGGPRSPRQRAASENQKYYDRTSKKEAEDLRKMLDRLIKPKTTPGSNTTYGPGGFEKDSGYKPRGLPGQPKSPDFNPFTAALDGVSTMLEAILTPFGLLIGILGLLLGALALGAANSKILGAIFKTVGDLLGLLVDLVLLPFLPILIWVIMGLITAILAFGKVWAEAMKFLGIGVSDEDKTKTIDKAIAEYDETPIGKAQKAIEEWVAGVGKQWDILKTAWDDFWKGVTWKALEKWWADVTKGFTDWMDGVGLQFDILKTAWDDFRKGVTWEALEKWWADVTKGFTDWMDGIGKQWDILKAMVTDFFKPVTDFIATFSWDPLIAGFKILLNGIFWLINAGVRAMNIPLGLLTFGKVQIPELPYLDSGGTIEKTGVAVVHKGETVVPAGQGTGSLTLNFYGYQDDKFIAKVKDVLRSEGTRYTQ